MSKMAKMFNMLSLTQPQAISRGKLYTLDYLILNSDLSQKSDRKSVFKTGLTTLSRRIQ